MAWPVGGQAGWSCAGRGRSRESRRLERSLQPDRADGLNLTGGAGSTRRGGLVDLALVLVHVLCTPLVPSRAGMRAWIPRGWSRCQVGPGGPLWGPGELGLALGWTWRRGGPGGPLRGPREPGFHRGWSGCRVGPSAPAAPVRFEGGGWGAAGRKGPAGRTRRCRRDRRASGEAGGRDRGGAARASWRDGGAGTGPDVWGAQRFRGSGEPRGGRAGRVGRAGERQAPDGPIRWGQRFGGWVRRGRASGARPGLKQQQASGTVGGRPWSSSGSVTAASRGQRRR